MQNTKQVCFISLIFFIYFSTQHAIQIQLNVLPISSWNSMNTCEPLIVCHYHARYAAGIPSKLMCHMFVPMLTCSLSVARFLTQCLVYFANLLCTKMDDVKEQCVCVKFVTNFVKVLQKLINAFVSIWWKCFRPNENAFIWPA